MAMSKGLKIAAGVFLGLFVVVYGCILLRGRSPDIRSVEELAQQALQADSRQKRERAAVQLASRGEESIVHLRQVLSTSESPQVRAACVEGLGRQWDYDSIEELFAALEDPSPLVRGRAGAALMRMLGRQRDFRADAPPEERQHFIRLLRGDWEEMKDKAPLERFRDPQRRKAGG